MPRVLLATDADWVHREIDAALAGDDISVLRVSQGSEVRPAVKTGGVDLVVLDLQIGNMGGMAACMDLRLDESVGKLEVPPILMLLDRDVDAFLAHRSQADGWLVKPLDAFRLRRAATALLGGAVLLSLGVALRAQRQRHDRLMKGVALGAGMGMLALLIHSAVDFNLQIPANAALFVVLMALAWVSLYLEHEPAAHPAAAPAAA